MTRRNLLGLAILGVALGLAPTANAQPAKDAPFLVNVKPGLTMSFAPVSQLEPHPVPPLWFISPPDPAV